AAATLRVGGEALIVSDEEGSLFVIGTLGDGRRSEASERRELVAADGTRVTLARRQDSEIVRLLSPSNGLVLEYDAATGKLTLSVPPGGLEVDGRGADLKLTTSGALRLQGGTVQIDSPGLTRLGTRELGVSAERGAFQVDHATFKSRTVIAVAGAIRLVAEKIETSAESIFEKARSVYRSVEGLVQTSAGRMRTLVGQTYHLKAERSVLRAKEIISLDAEKIHLG
ncbi:MAG TPA: DUF3540 domain-containing protein, partial [Candidatus Polarisedimenticolia bacterium]|nr:DUF3540 domain-containing protein [Candidatus Polarisedimenticolia bacterium]